MNTEDFIARYPRLFHMAADGSWESIRQRGLLSTRSLVELYKPPLALAEIILREVRKQTYYLDAPGLPTASVRDQLPLKFIDDCLLPGVSVQDFLDALNGRVFFHVSAARLHTLMQARAYRNGTHDVLTLDTRAILESHTEIDLAPYNTGSVHVPNMPARGPETFVPLEQYPWDYWRKRRGEDNAVVELTIKDSALVSPAVLSVEKWSGGALAGVIWQG